MLKLFIIIVIFYIFWIIFLLVFKDTYSRYKEYNILIHPIIDCLVRYRKRRSDYYFKQLVKALEAPFSLESHSAVLTWLTNHTDKADSDPNLINNYLDVLEGKLDIQIFIYNLNKTSSEKFLEQFSSTQYKPRI